ncbi:MAG: mechanosensitive ion channel domain-containing protein, partial [Bacteroidota bacterium]
NVVFYFIFLNIVLIALRQADLQTSFMETNISIILAGVAGAFAIGYGFASKDIMSNLLASFYNRGRLEVGDEITIDGRRGEIIQINNNTITLRTETSEILMPYRMVTNGGVEIHSRRDRPNTLPPPNK